ncbi:hypothetical protein FNF31_07252 [Cafeteria roenbergensis]|uniref:U3 small nucleolar ribonucleoprotein protein IMP3 n=1 Tax=Cafeteria roenbergensis TaxID=33653 RepID=A0A5A8C851_CAFRO|nr:hypothetical protein FNF31_07252 [Cafeteria roenbergensis]CAE7937906.1 IMP3 [Symbiodinium sp. KB8]
MSGLRKLKWHEKKLLRKVDFLEWKQEKNIRVIKILRRYMIENREDYTKYDLLAGAVKKLAARLKHLPADNALRVRVTEELLEKLERMGLIDVASSLAKAEAITASAYARRRLPVVLVRMRMSQTVKDATELVKHGHIRVGPEVITDPAYLVTRPMEDFVTWVDTSKIKRTVMRYNDKLDDFDLLGE